MSMRYAFGSWHRPYGAGDDAEARGFGQGGGTVSGDIEGEMVWANYPRRRQDGVWTPNLRGVITTREGEQLLCSIHGQSVQEQGPSARRSRNLAGPVSALPQGLSLGRDSPYGGDCPWGLSQLDSGMASRC
jgi:hypothetical protein